MVTGPINVADFLTPSGRPDPNRRTRIAAEVDHELRGWLKRAAAAHAHIACIVRLFGNPARAGGASLQGEDYAERLARGDRTILHDCVTFVRDEMDELRRDIERRMDDTPPTAHLPGTPQKVAVLAERMANGHSLFLDGDAQK